MQYQRESGHRDRELDVDSPATPPDGSSSGRDAFHRRTRRAVQRRPLHCLPNRSTTCRKPKNTFASSRCRTKKPCNGTAKATDFGPYNPIADPAHYRFTRERLAGRPNLIVDHSRPISKAKSVQSSRLCKLSREEAILWLPKSCWTQSSRSSP